MKCTEKWVSKADKGCVSADGLKAGRLQSDFPVRTDGELYTVLQGFIASALKFLKLINKTLKCLLKQYPKQLVLF